MIDSVGGLRSYELGADQREEVVEAKDNDGRRVIGARDHDWVLARVLAYARVGRLLEPRDHRERVPAFALDDERPNTQIMAAVARLAETARDRVAERVAERFRDLALVRGAFRSL